jgi:adenylate cyclase
MGDQVTESTALCPTCGTELRATARFCDGCGSPVASNRSVGERKQVTVLFTDVVGSMTLAATLDPERLQEIMHELFNRAAAVVQHYGGTVDKFTGDGLMALFGAPAALEDHALRACIAALEIQVAAKELAAELLRRDNIEVIRVGLNSGEVVAGEIGAAGAPMWPGSTESWPKSSAHEPKSFEQLRHSPIGQDLAACLTGRAVLERLVCERHLTHGVATYRARQTCAGVHP